MLALAYRTAAEPTRAALRQVMADSGGLDLVRVIAARRERATPMTVAERQYLAARLADRRDWAGLWRLALEFPLAEAAGAVRLLDPGWCPADGAGRRLLSRFAPVSPGDAWPDRHRPRGSSGKPPLTVERIQTPGSVQAGSFSPDGRRLAVVTLHTMRYDGGSSVCEFDLPHGALLARYDYPDDFPAHVLHLGDAIVAGGWWRGRATRDGPVSRGPDLLAGGNRQPLPGIPEPVAGLVSYGDGFIALRGRRELWLPGIYRGTVGEHQLLFCDSRGRVLRGTYPLDGDWVPRCLAADPGSMRVALSIGLGIRLSGRYGEQRLAGSRPRVFADAMCFLGPDQLAVAGHTSLEVWQVRGQRLVRRSASEHVRYPHPVDTRDVVWIPARDQLAIRTNHPYQGLVHYYDIQTLAPADDQDGLAGSYATALWAAPGGYAHAVGHGPGVELAFAAHPLARLLARPMGEMVPSDLASVAGALGASERFPAERPALELLRACLEHRFGADVAIGAAAAGDPDDIALSGSRYPGGDAG